MVKFIPSLLIDKAPIGKTRTVAEFFERLIISETAFSESVAGIVFGIAQIVVNPPAAAAALPDWKFSLCVSPGSLK